MSQMSPINVYRQQYEKAVNSRLQRASPHPTVQKSRFQEIAAF